MYNTSAKCVIHQCKRVIQCNLQMDILDYDWLMNNRVWSGPMKTFIFTGERNLWLDFSLMA